MKDDSAKIAELEGMVQALKKENKELKDKKEELIVTACRGHEG